MKDMFNRDPDAINEIGTKFWKSESWRGYNILYVETRDGYRTIIATDKNGEVVAENQSLESVAVKIDSLVIASGGDLLKT